MISSSVTMPSESGRKLLIITQKVDKTDTTLGFFHEWIRAFSNELSGEDDRLTVLALSVGEYDLQGVRVLSLGKENGVSRLKYIFRFYKIIWKERKNYDDVFVHMNPIYVVLGGLYWRLLGKRIVLWYTHRTVDLKLRIAVFFSHKVFTAAPESMRISTSKKEVLGHGIDVAQFQCSTRRNDGIFTILHVGRITEIKNCDTIIEAVQRVYQKTNTPIRLVFLGEPVTPADNNVLHALKEKTKSFPEDIKVVWEGGVPHRALTEWYCKADLTINATPTGGIDKVVLESFLCFVPTLTSNKAFSTLFEDKADRLLFNFRSEDDLAEKIEYFLKKSQEERIQEIKKISQRVRNEYNLETLIHTILSHGF